MKRPIWREALPTFEDRATTIKDWLTECHRCEQGHEGCKPQDPARLLPTRLLDLERVPGFGDDPRLVHTADLDHATTRYTTLSHCWGPPVVTPPLTTTSSTIDGFFSSIPFQSLPQNFKDAVLLTRMLDIRYLWIDSLCIVQDDILDWQVESGRMASYYQNSHLTIAAAASAHCHSGFIQELDSSLYGSSAYTAASYSDGVATMRTTTATEGLRLRHDLTENPLLQRAWVLQEQVLSPRTVFCFGNSQMYWQCRNFFASEDGTIQAHRLALMWCHVERPFDMSDPRAAHSLWWHLVDDYSRRRMTFVSDRGPAIAGLVEFYRYATGHTPLLGLWKETLCFDLSWSASVLQSENANIEAQVPTGRPAARFPTWSWLSILSSEGRSTITMWLSPEQVEAEGYATELEVLSAETSWHASPFTSGLRSAKLEVRGWTMNAVLGEPIRDDFCGTKGLLVSLKLLDKPETPHPKWNEPRNARLDRYIDQSSSLVIILLHLHQEIVLKDLLYRLDDPFRFPREKICYVEDTYLCLRQCSDDPTKYQRIGISQETSFFPWGEGVAAFGKSILGGWVREENRRVLELV